MSNKRQCCLLAFLFSIAVTGCAGAPATPPAYRQSRHVRVAEYFPMPVPLKDSRVIRLEISAISGALHFVSLDQPDTFYDIRLMPTGVTAERDHVILEADEVHWHIGETVITLKARSRTGPLRSFCMNCRGKTSEFRWTV